MIGQHVIGAELFAGAFGAWGAAMWASGLVDRLTLAVEKDPWRREVLVEHGLYERIEEDVREVRGEDLRGCDVLAGSPPCRGFSVAGRGEGFAHLESALWFEMLRCVREARPSIVLVENAGRGWARWVPVVRSGLAELGYVTVPLHLSASEIGAPHERLRCFVVGAAPHAHAAVRILGEREPRRQEGKLRARGEAIAPDDGVERAAPDDGVERAGPDDEVRGPDGSPRPSAPGCPCGSESPDSDPQGQPQQGRPFGALGRWARYVRDRGYWRSWPASAVLPRVDDGVPCWLDVDRIDRAQREAAAGDAIVYPVALTVCLAVREALELAARDAGEAA